MGNSAVRRGTLHTLMSLLHPTDMEATPCVKLKNTTENVKILIGTEKHCSIRNCTLDPHGSLLQVQPLDSTSNSAKDWNVTAILLETVPAQFTQSLIRRNFMI